MVIAGSDNALVTLPAAMLIAALFAAVIGAFSLRTSGMHFIMITLAFAPMRYYLFVSLEAYDGDDGLSLYARNRLPGSDLADDRDFDYLCRGLLLALLYLARRLTVSRFGLVIKGIRENEQRMLALDFPVYRYKLACFIIAGAAAGLAGALMEEFLARYSEHWMPFMGPFLVLVVLYTRGVIYGLLSGRERPDA